MKVKHPLHKQIIACLEKAQQSGRAVHLSPVPVEPLRHANGYNALMLAAGSFMPGYAPYGPPGYGPPQSAGPAYAPHQHSYAPAQPGAYGNFEYAAQYGSFPDQYGQQAYGGNNQYQAQQSYMPQQAQQYGPPRPLGMQGAASATDAYIGGGQSSERGRREHLQRVGQGKRSQ